MRVTASASSPACCCCCCNSGPLLLILQLWAAEPGWLPPSRQGQPLLLLLLLLSTWGAAAQPGARHAHLPPELLPVLPLLGRQPGGAGRLPLLLAAVLLLCGWMVESQP